MKFKFIEFNPRRDLRGAEAARVAVIDDEGREDWLWMSKRDIAKNIKAFGACDELAKARDAYKSKGPSA
jgi:hypothetical protein